MPLENFTNESPRALAMRLFARVPWVVLDPLTKELAQTPITILRKPETGLIMVRGRIGSTGAAFNLGEATVTRCSLRHENGKEGHGYVMGRNADHAVRIAICDAVYQHTPDLLVPMLDTLEDVLTRMQIKTAAKAAATKVDFFTMVRGDD